MGKIKDFIAAATPVTTSDGREVFAGNAKERKAIKRGAKVGKTGYIEK
jgi:hypothetical protein